MKKFINNYKGENQAQELLKKYRNLFDKVAEHF
jgi:uncharacterized pyridoxal phosphate-containing UPF0001 family protein